MSNHWTPLFKEKQNPSTSTFKSRINELNRAIQGHKRIVFFGGAGISTASGIPDFRSKDGLYNRRDIQFEKYQPEYLLSKDCLFESPKVFYEFYKQKLDCRNVKPNIAHHKLAKMEAQSNLVCVITQNIDGLHQKAGSKNVIEIHGSANRIYCTKCRKEYSSDYLFKNTDAVPKCECGGQIRPDITLYGELLPPVFEQAVEEIEKADMLIVAGSSLTVYPANTLLRHFSGNCLVLINHDATPFDRYADILFDEDISDVFNGVRLKE